MVRARPTVLTVSIQIFQGGGAETASKDNNLAPNQSVGAFERISACPEPSVVVVLYLQSYLRVGVFSIRTSQSTPPSCIRDLAGQESA